MKKVKHIIFWIVVIGIILLLFSSHVIAQDFLGSNVSQREITCGQQPEQTTLGTF